MTKFIEIDPEESIAAIYWRGVLRFVYDSYDPSYSPKEGEFRYGSLVVDDSNIEQWIESMSGELTVEQIPYARWEEDEQVQLTVVIDFDVNLWIGHLWRNDQSAYQDYQPAGWIALEDFVFNYLPDNYFNLPDVVFNQKSLGQGISDPGCRNQLGNRCLQRTG